MTIEEFKQLSDQEKELIFRIAKVVAESDSIGEGYGYCGNYSALEYSEDFCEWESGKNYFFETTYLGVAVSIFELTKKYYDNIPT